MSLRSLKVIDVRPLASTIPNVEFIQADLMGKLRNDLISSCDSLPCLHALEHFGLGRYGDPVQYDGDILGLNNLFNILKPQGKFYISLPIGPKRIEFNAHRVFLLNYLFELFADRFVIDRFSFVDDAGDLHKDIKLDCAAIAGNCGCHCGCGIFEMTKTSGHK